MRDLNNPENGITMAGMETIIDYLKRVLRDAGPARWEPIAAEAGVAKTLPRKIVYGDRENPGVQTVQPLIDFFLAVERGDRVMPAPVAPAVAEPEPTKA